jgi:hypothetical protein
MINADAPVYDFIRLRLLKASRCRWIYGDAGESGAGLNRKTSGKFGVSLRAGDAGAENYGVVSGGAGAETWRAGQEHLVCDRPIRCWKWSR